MTSQPPQDQPPGDTLRLSAMSCSIGTVRAAPLVNGPDSFPCDRDHAPPEVTASIHDGALAIQAMLPFERGHESQSVAILVLDEESAVALAEFICSRLMVPAARQGSATEF